MNTECMYRISRNKKGESIASCIVTLAMDIYSSGKELYMDSVAVVKKDTKALTEVYENKFFHPVRHINLKKGDVVIFVGGKLHAMYDVGYTSVKLMFPDFDLPFDEYFEDIYQFNENEYSSYYEICRALRSAKII